MTETLDALELPITRADRDRLTAWARDLVRAERARAVALCRGRAALWENTDLVRSPAAAAREEARARAKEAADLADLIAAER